MANATTYEGNVQRQSQTGGTLFAGQKLWFSQSVPQRQRLMLDAELNGAQLVPLDKQADVRIVDHLRKNQAPGTHSYRYVELSIRCGQLEDLDAHRVGSVARVNRPVGSTITASKGGRNKFTNEEDQLLWNWVKPCMDAGGSWKGNEIYKQLERINPNHTFQSWRDRWIKHTQFSDRHITATPTLTHERHESIEETPPSPKRRRVGESPKANIGVVQEKRIPRSTVETTLKPVMGNVESSQSVLGSHKDGLDKQRATVRTANENEIQESNDPETVERDVNDKRNTASIDNSRPEPDVNGAGAETEGGDDGDEEDVESLSDSYVDRLPLAYNFTQEEAIMLYRATPHILNARRDKIDESWRKVGREYPRHSQKQWRVFFYEFIKPEYMKRNNIEDEEQLKAFYRAQLSSKHRDSSAGEPNSSRERTCVKCSKTESESWRFDGRGRSYCHHCSKGLEDLTQTSAADFVVHATVQGESSDVHSGEHRRPQPNESRKLGLSRTSQSASSHSQSLSTSNPSQQPRQSDSVVNVLSVKNFRQKPTDLISGQGSRSGSPSLRQPLSTKTIDSPARRTIKDDLNPENHAVKSSEAFHEPNNQAGPARSVTQASSDTSKSISQNNGATNQAHVQRAAFDQSSVRSESPLFVPEEHETASEHESSHSPSVRDLFEQRSISPVVQLVHDEEIATGPDKVSEYASSETNSENMIFDNETQLTQAWETAPDEIAQEPADDQDEQEAEQFADRARLELIASQTLLEMTASSDESQELSSEIASGTKSVPEKASISAIQGESNGSASNTDRYETAPMHFRPDGDHEILKKKVDTQALFEQHATQADLANLAALPEPPGGWDDEDEIDEHNSIVVDKSKDQDSLYQADTTHDWTLLPPPEDDDDDEPGHDTALIHPAPNSKTIETTLSTTTPTNNNFDEDIDDVDNWLASQPAIFPTVSQILLQPISHRALESTSMDFDLANTVLTSMINRLESKGKHPSPRTLRKLPRPERKQTLNRIAEDLLPADVSGCWTREDDYALVGEDGRAVERVAEKHGEESFRRRFEFLEVWHAN